MRKNILNLKLGLQTQGKMKIPLLGVFTAVSSTGIDRGISILDKHHSGTVFHRERRVNIFGRREVGW